VDPSPYDEIGKYVGMRRILLRTAESGVVLTDVVAFSCGFKLGADVVRRGGDMMTAFADMFDARGGRATAATLLRVTVEFSDGQLARNTDNRSGPDLNEPEPR
jgi:hypothetical protein